MGLEGHPLGGGLFSLGGRESLPRPHPADQVLAVGSWAVG